MHNDNEEDHGKELDEIYGKIKANDYNNLTKE